LAEALAEKLPSTFYNFHEQGFGYGMEVKLLQ